MSVHEVVQLQRATPDDASAIAQLHANALRDQVCIARGKVVGRGLHPTVDPSTWRGTLAMASEDHRPWIATSGDRVVGVVTAGPERSATDLRTAEIYVLDTTHDCTDALQTLLEHACRDLTAHGFTGVTMWTGAQDLDLRLLLQDLGWHMDDSRRWESVVGVPILQVRYRRALG